MRLRVLCIHVYVHMNTYMHAHTGTIFDLPPAVCQSFYALGQLRPSATPDVIRDFYSYLGILSLAFDAVLQPGCDGGSADFPTRFLYNVRTFAQPCLTGLSRIDSCSATRVVPPSLLSSS